MADTDAIAIDDAESIGKSTADATTGSLAISNLTVESGDHGYAMGLATADAEWESTAVTIGLVASYGEGIESMNGTESAIGVGSATAVVGGGAASVFDVTSTNGGHAMSTADSIAFCTGLICPEEPDGSSDQGAVAVSISEADGKYYDGMDTYTATALSDADSIAIGAGSLAFAIATAKADLEFYDAGGGEMALWTAGSAEADALSVAAFGGTANSLSFADATNLDPNAALGTEFDQAAAFGIGGAAWAWGYRDPDLNIALSGAVSIAVQEGTTADSASTVVADTGLNVEASVTVTPP
jgi:hypothetical protein